MAVLPTDYTDSITPTGATTEYPATTTRGLNATHTQINTNTDLIGGKTIGKLAPVRCADQGSETYTVSSGTVTQIAGTTINGVSPAVGDRVLLQGAPAATGVGSFGSTQPGNGIYTVTSNTTNLSLSRAADMSGSVNPSGLTVMVTDGAWWTTRGLTVVTPNNPAAAFTYGSGSIAWTMTSLPTPINDTSVNTLTGKTIDGANNTLIVRAADIPSGITNGNTATQSQTVVSATVYYITNSNLNLPATLKTGMAVGTRFRWTVAMAKTAAGTGAFAIRIFRGTNGTTADTADVNQTIGTQTAAVDSMTLDVEVVVTTTGATGAYFWSIIPTSKAVTATGFGVATGPTGQFSGTVSSVALNTASLKFGLGFSATTGTPTITIPMVRAQALNIS